LPILMLIEYRPKAENETSMSPARRREPGKVEAGVSAEIEWTRELQTERDF
jgi:hypothetical protein